MLNEKELRDFLELLHHFGLATGLSDRQLSMLFGISHQTMNRWMRLQKATDLGRSSVYRWMSDPIRTKIEYLNAFDTQHRLFVAINREHAAQRVAIMRRQLDHRTVT